MARIPQSISKRSSQSNNVRKESIPDYLAEILFFEGSMTEERAILLGNRMIHYAKTNPNVITFSKFFEQERICERSVRRWRKEFPVLDVAFEFVKDMFAERRAQLAQKMDNKFISSEMHLYSFMHEEYNNLEHERKKELKKITEENKNDNTTKIIVLSQLETGELVPISGKKDEHGE